MSRVALLGIVALASCAPPQSRAIPPPAPAFEIGALQETDDAFELRDRELEAYIRSHYDKREVRIPMRDGVELFTAIYTPRHRRDPRPILMKRTPYSVRPYGDELPEKLGPSELLARREYIFVYQDVRGCYMSGGQFVNMTPHIDEKRGKQDVDESSDTYDTIAWLLENVEGHNGRVGQWGISYPGFYAAAGMIDAHPALRAVSPQAPIADWFFDDFHHHGAFFLPHAFNFLVSFGRPRPEPTTERGPRFEHGTPDGFQFFFEMGPLRNANEVYLKGEIPFWNDVAAHPNYDEFWQTRNLLPHLHKVAPAVMIVGGWFDAEDLYGPLNIYRAVEDNNPDAFNMLVMGPWRHGGWSRDDGRRLGEIDFGSDTSVDYRQKVEAPFFMRFLEDEPAKGLPEARVFETGANAWRDFDQWPPRGLKSARLFVRSDGRLSREAPPASGRAFDSYVSDPDRPVPFTQATAKGMTREYMVDDQRFAARRPDVLAYQTEPLAEPLTIAGPVVANLWVSTSGSASDFVVKLIDVFPGDATLPPVDGETEDRDVGGYQMMVRSEVIRARFRDGYAVPKPMRPGIPTEIELPLQDVLHTFKPGHRVMVQIQSTWFPLVDRNPQKYVPNIFEARQSDFIVTTQKVWRSRTKPTHLQFGTLP